ncbi:MAG: HU family DNA-binding protein [Gammaproteobacteria bacterium]
MANDAPKPPTKAQLISLLADETGLTRADVNAVMDALYGQIQDNLSLKTGSGSFNLPGLIKIQVTEKPATPEREGVNPFTGEAITIAAKPARKAVKLRALKGLKDML